MNSQITIGNYKNTQYSINSSTNVITLNGLDFVLDITKIKLVANQTQGKLYAAKSFWQGNVVTQSMPITTVTPGNPSTGGNITLGTHYYAATYTYITGEETLPSVLSAQVTISGSNKTVPLTNIPIGNTNVIARNIYRTLAGTSTPLYLITTILDNSTSSYTDTAIDSSIANIAPTTTLVYDISLGASFATMNASDYIDIECEIPNSNEDDDLGVTKNINLDNAELPPVDPEVATATDTNLALGTYYYELPVGPWRNYLGQIKATCASMGSTIRIYKTLDPAAAVPATNGTPSVDWVEHTQNVFNVPQISVPITGTLITPIINWSIDDNGMMTMYDRYLMQYTVLWTTNFFQLNVRRF